VMASAAASSQEVGLVPITSITRYTLMVTLISLAVDCAHCGGSRG
jgi:hypothetical protein